MAKIVAWLVLIFLVLLALRLVNQRKARRQGDDAPGAAAVEPMVRCARCGVFLPRAEATQRSGEYVCADGQCIKR